MQRRAFLVATALFMLPVSAVASSRRIGFISSSTTELNSPFLAALRKGLLALGYEEGQNLEIDYRFAHSRDQLPEMAAHLVAKQVELILAAGSEGIVAAREATKTIPIVMTNSGDAVREGFAVSLRSPGGNITGMTQLSPELAGKRLEMLREIFTDLTRVGILWNPDHPNTPITFQEAKAATEKLRLQPVSIEIRNTEDIQKGLTKAGEQNIRAFLVIRDPFTVRNRVAIVRTLHALHMLAIFETSDFVEAGGLMYYGADFEDLFRQSATYVDKVLKGAKPADLPIQQPSKFLLVVNQKVAAERGIKIPETLLVRADRLIE